MPHECKTAALVLAAGSSRRFKEGPKQLVKINGETLLNRAIRVANESKASDVFVVLGANARDVSATIKTKKPPIIVENLRHQEGIGTSIAKGISEISKTGRHDAVCILLADQPFIASSHINQIIASFNGHTNALSVSCYPDNSKGPPTLIGADYFGELQKLKDDCGARSVIQKHKDKVNFIKLENFNPVDIDTVEDYRRLRQIIESKVTNSKA